MEKQTIRKAVEDAACALKLDRRIVGVKFIFDQAEFESFPARKLKGRMAYCVMVRSAMQGKGLKAAVENAGCNGGARALGLIPLDELSTSGRFYHSLNLYCDLSTAKQVQRTMTFCKHHLYGIAVQPLEEYDAEPDVVLMVTNPYNAMRIMQAYTYAFGYNTSLKMAGNQAICSECTAFPFERNDINVSLLCSGTRFKAKWKDEELALGMPLNRFPSVVEGLYATLDPIEPDHKKREIEKRFEAQGRTGPAIHYGRNYYTGLNPDSSRKQRSRSCKQ